jgi:hypothetical protein
MSWLAIVAIALAILFALALLDLLEAKTERTRAEARRIRDDEDKR